MEIEIIPLAKRKAQRRNIKEEWIAETVQSSQQVTEGHGGRKVAQRIYTIGSRDYLLRAVYEEHPETIVVVTAYLTSQVSRYWLEQSDEA